MPTNDRLSFTAALAWLRAQVDRLRRSVMARRPVVRWSLAVARGHRLDVGGLLGRHVVQYPGRSLSRLGPAVLVRRPDQGLYRPRQATSSATASMIHGASKWRPISTTRPPTWSPSSTWANDSIDEIREAILHIELFRLAQRPGEQAATRSRKDHRGTHRSARRGCLVAGVDQSPATSRWLRTDRKADGLRLHRDRGKPAIAVSNRPVDPGDPDWLRARSDARVDHRDGPPRQPVFGLRQPGDRRSPRATGPGKRSSSRRSSRSSTGSRECGSRSR